MVVSLASGALTITAAASFDDVFRTAYHRVVGIAVATTGDPALAEDAAQEAFARAHARWDHVGELDRPDLWIAKVAVRVAVDGWRRTRREAGPISAGAEAAVPDAVRRLWIRHGLEQLSPMQRASVLMRYAEGRPLDEVAERMGRSPSTIKTHVADARRRLRSLLRQEDE
jgi:RNA polymerase sigma-70 factor (ECF subfamily)